MRNLIVLGVLTAIVSLCGGYTAAAEKAATAKMPAALSAVSAQPNQVLTSADASQVRGNGFCIWFHGFVVTDGMHGRIQVEAHNLQGINFRVSSHGLSLSGR